MTAKFAKELETDKDMDWPEILLDIIEGLVWDRFTCLMGVWRRAQPHIDKDSAIENSKEQEKWIVADKEAELKANRHWGRWKAVSAYYWHKSIRYAEYVWHLKEIYLVRKSCSMASGV